MLTGKYNDGSIPEGSRFAETPYMMFKFNEYFGTEDKKKKTTEQFNAIQALAKEHGLTMAQFALGWAIANKDVSVALLGFTRLT